MPASRYYHSSYRFTLIFSIIMVFVAQPSNSLHIVSRRLVAARIDSGTAKRGLLSAAHLQLGGHFSGLQCRIGSGGIPRFLFEGSFRYHSSTTACQLTIADTPLGTKEGRLLLDGLDVYSVPAREDNHPLTVFGIESSNPQPDDHILLMLHGRTWSSVPVYHLLGGATDVSRRGVESGVESRSLMEALLRNKIQVYAMDFRGFGGTPKDATGAIEPNRCVEDVESVLGWLGERHGCSTPEKISLMGWSQGALVAQLAAQRRRPHFSRLILYGSIYDPMVRYPREPLYIRNRENATETINSFDAAVEDFTIEGTIPPKAATIFAETALLSDPIKAQWKALYQFNTCNPARVHVPTLVVSTHCCV
jgi:pimeloyl-ACP methyl ester carboxylesterase